LLDHTGEDSAIRCATTRDSDGRLFVDRNGSVFAEVLEYLRTGDVNVACSSNAKRAAFYAELRFFGVPDCMPEPVMQPTKQYVTLQRLEERVREKEMFILNITGPKSIINEVVPGATTKRLSSSAFRWQKKLSSKAMIDQAFVSVLHDLLSNGFSFMQAASAQMPEGMLVLVRESAGKPAADEDDGELASALEALAAAGA